ncbi:MAG: hypothetical protein ACN6O7_11140 [Sphingobacterium sp.]
MNKKKLVILMGALGISVFFLLWFGNFGEKVKIRESEKIIEKISDYQRKNGHLPNSLKDIGIEEKLEGPFFYTQWDSVNYMLYFTTGVGESMNYYSDTKEWDYRLRGMGEYK